MNLMRLPLKRMSLRLMPAVRMPLARISLRLLPFLAILSIIALSELAYHFLLKDYLWGLADFLLCVCMFLVPVYLFRNNLKLYLLILLPVILLAPLNLLYVCYFESRLSEATVLMILNTNRSEAMELIRNYTMVLSICSVIFIVALYFLYTKVAKTIKPRPAAYISIISLVVLTISPLGRYNRTENYLKNVGSVLSTIYPANVAAGLENVWQQDRLIKESQKERNRFTFNSRPDPSIMDKQVHILIIGESSRYDHWGINGYNRNTSPLLSKKENLVSFNNTAAGGFMTEWSVPLLLTGLGADNYRLNLYRKGIVSAFGEAGFRTYWITNQTDHLGNVRMHSSEAQKGYNLLTDFRSNKNVHRDMELVDMLKKILGAPGNKKFIVLHTLGSHYSYSARYPDRYDVIKPSNKTVPLRLTDKSAKSVLINSYDNSILYTDAVIDSVISMVSKLNDFSSVTYISDHGEDLFDDSRNLTSHHSGSPPSKYDIHIPFFIWYSPKLKSFYPAKISHLLEHKDAKTSSEDVLYSITSLAGLRFPGLDSLKDLTSAYFKNSTQLVLGDKMKVYHYADLK